MFLLDPSKKVLKEGELPQLNLPSKSIPTKLSKPRSTASIAKRENADICADKLSPEFCYKSLDEFKKRINQLKLPNDWLIENKDEYCLIKEVDPTLVLPKVENYASNDLSFFIRISGWNLPDSHKLYVKYNKSFKYITLSRLISEITVMKLYPGVDPTDINNSLVIQRHIVRHVFEFPSHKLSKANQLEYLRSDNCALLSKEEQSCSKCQKLKVKVKSEMNWKRNKLMSPSKLKAPISLTSPTRLKLAMQQERLKCKQLEVEFSKMKTEIEKAVKPVEKILVKTFAKYLIMRIIANSFLYETFFGRTTEIHKLLFIKQY